MSNRSILDINVPGFKLVGKLGSGSFSTVYKASDLQNPQQYVAIKCISLSNLSASRKDDIINEVKIMKLLKHEFIVKLIDSLWDDKYLYLILEYCEIGDLSSILKGRLKLSEKIFHKFLQQLALALQFLRFHNVSHFDLKPQNLLLTKCPKLTLKIGDFGLAQFLSEESLKTSIRGSPMYMAPEMLLKRSTSPKADLWSVGVLSYQCLFGLSPIPNSNLCQIIKSHENQVPIEFPKNIISSECEDFLSRLLVYDPIVRMDFDEFFNHPFLDLEHYPTEESYLKGVGLIHQAVELDYEKDYKTSFNLYCQALQYFVPYVRDLEDPVKKESIRAKVFEYTRRAEELQSFLTKDYYVKDEKAKSSKGNDVESESTSSSSSSKENVVESESKSISLESLCISTPSLITALEIGKVGHMYLMEKNYTDALEKLKSALAIAIPVMQNEPPGKRKDLLVKKIQEWLTYAENIKVLLAVKNSDQILECSDACVIQ